jgi:hypothetical protein
LSFVLRRPSAPYYFRGAVLELDHIFIFCSPNDGYEDRLSSLGLVETYRRRHPGQGTENICFCFDNAFIELLWVNNETEIRSLPVARTALHERSRHLELGTCPLGIAWRGSGSISTWPYRPPYLPPPLAIDVATDGDDPNQPMMFRSPGDSPPSAWPSERRGHLQRQAGFETLRIHQLAMPAHTSPSPALKALATNLGIVITNSDRGYQMDIEVSRLNGQAPMKLRLNPGVNRSDPSMVDWEVRF